MNQHKHMLRNGLAGHHPMKSFGVTPIEQTTDESALVPQSSDQPNQNSGTSQDVNLALLLTGTAIAAGISGAWSGVSAKILKYKFADGFKIGALSTVLLMGTTYILTQGKKK